MGTLKRKKTPFFLTFVVLYGVLWGAGMAEISAKPFFHPLQPQTRIFAKFHFFIIFAQKVRARPKNKHAFTARRFFASM